MNDREEKYAKTLAAMLSCETVSTEKQTDLTKFYRFHELLRELFPHLFTAAEFEEYGACILVRWKGKTPEGNAEKLPVLFMNHHDVVEAQGKWKHEPFSGDIAEGKVWGRGALDTKGGLWGMLTAADELIEEGFVPDRDIYFESSAAEEISHSYYGAYTIAKVLEERGIRFEWILDEGGMIMHEPISGVNGTFAMVGLGEKGCNSLKFIAKGKGGHASAPENNTPLVCLGRFMNEADKMKVFKKELSPVMREMFRRLAPYVRFPMNIVYGHPGLFHSILEIIMPKLSGTPRALVQTTIAFTMASGSEGYNVIPAEAYVVGNMRTSHHQKFKESFNAISELAAKYDIETEILEEGIDSKLSNYDSEGFKLIETAVNSSFKDVKTAPYIMTGGSDLRFMDKLGENCFHFVPFLIDKEQLESIHGINECVDIKTLAPAVDFYKVLMRG